MKSILLIIVFCISYPVTAQTDYGPRVLSFNVGSSKAGSGDMSGIRVGFGYEKFFKRRLSWSLDFTTTINNSQEKRILTDEAGKTYDLSSRYTTAGIQLGGKASYYIFRSKQWAGGIRLGTVLRRQSSSLPDAETTVFPILTNYPVPLTYVENNSPQTTYSVGGTFDLFANYTIKQKILLGVGTAVQLDTKGDSFFPQVFLSIGRRF